MDGSFYFITFKIQFNLNNVIENYQPEFGHQHLKNCRGNLLTQSFALKISLVRPLLLEHELIRLVLFVLVRSDRFVALQIITTKFIFSYFYVCSFELIQTS